MSCAEYSTRWVQHPSSMPVRGFAPAHSVVMLVLRVRHIRFDGVLLRVRVKGLLAPRRAEVIGLSLILRLPGCRLRVDQHSTDWIFHHFTRLLVVIALPLRLSRNFPRASG